MSEPRLPDFLIVGAMKAGTTQLFSALGRHPDIWCPPQKEPETLLRQTTTREVRRDWGALFSATPAGARCGEASTGYTKGAPRPDLAVRALAAAGPGLRIIYIEREPVARLVSHFRHLQAEGRGPDQLSDALREAPELLDASRYEAQIAPWVGCFGAGVIRLRFEEFVLNPHAALGRVAQALEVDPSGFGPIPDRRNATGGKRVARSKPMRRLIASDIYQRRVKPHLSQPVREGVKAFLAPRRRPGFPTLDTALRRRIEEALRSD